MYGASFPHSVTVAINFTKFLWHKFKTLADDGREDLSRERFKDRLHLMLLNNVLDNQRAFVEAVCGHCQGIQFCLLSNANQLTDNTYTTNFVLFGAVIHT